MKVCLAYKCLSLKEQQQVLAKEFFFQGDFEYYADLKELAIANQDEFYMELKQVLKAAKGWNTERILLKLIEEENDLAEILEFVRNNPSYIETYVDQLVEHFPEKVIEIFAEYIKASAKGSSNRREYQRVCRKIKKFKKSAGQPKQIELIDELRSLYKKRPAFLDELGKIK